ncbi:MAG TPA: peptidylprolyl isomerase [Bryobacteraceae bacterium]|nr:peptidylprolyl isomerase [Bryobacteraceae bacterium]
MPYLINGQVVEDAEFREEADRLRPRLSASMPDSDPLEIGMRASEWARRNVVEKVLLQQEALNDPEPVPPELVENAIQQMTAQSAGRTGCILPGKEQDFRREVEIQLRVERLFAKLTTKVARPRKSEVSDFYRTNRNRFFVHELVHAAHIVKNIDEKTDEAAAHQAIVMVQGELRNGRKFEELADEFSDCPGSGGNLGFFPRGQMVDEFDTVVFSLAPGEVSDIFRSPFGFHIAKVYEHKPEGIAPLSEARDEIEHHLLRERQQQTIAQFVDDLRARADIRKLPRNSGTQESAR